MQYGRSYGGWVEQGMGGLGSGPHSMKSIEGVWQVYPGNDDVASSRHPSNKAAEMSLPGMAPASPRVPQR